MRMDPNHCTMKSVKNMKDGIHGVGRPQEWWAGRSCSFLQESPERTDEGVGLVKPGDVAATFDFPE